MSAGSTEQEVWLDAAPPELARARALVDAAAAAAGFDDDRRFEIAVATNEALTNAIEHGSPCPGGTLMLRIVPETNALTVCVCDCGTYRPSVPAGPLAEHGRGLPFMRMLMDEVELVTEDDGTLVRLVKRAAL